MSFTWASLCVPVRDKWDHNETNQQVASYLQGARDKSANKPQIVAAYANNYDPASWAADPKDPSKQIHPQVTPEYGTCIEAESNQASVSGGARIFSGDDSASGGAYAGDFYQGGDAVTFTIDAGQLVNRASGLCLTLTGRQERVTSTAVVCARLDRAVTNCAIILRLRLSCMRLGRPLVVQVTSTMVLPPEGIKPATMFSPQDIMPIGVSKVTT